MEIGHWRRTMEDLLQSARTPVQSRRGAAQPVPGPTAPAAVERSSSPMLAEALPVVDESQEVTSTSSVSGPLVSEVVSPAPVLDESRIAMAAAYELMLGVRYTISTFCCAV